MKMLSGLNICYMLAIICVTIAVCFETWANEGTPNITACLTACDGHGVKSVSVTECTCR